MRIFLDTNMFFCYATDFENNHCKAIKLFEGNHDKYTGMRVKAELKKVKRRRDKLYRDLLNFYTRNDGSIYFRPTVKLCKNDETHLDSLINQLNSVNKTENLTHLRQMIQFIEKGIAHALSLVIRPLVGFSGDLVSEVIMESCISNGNDARILVDALCWAEKTSPVIFCTQDYSDLIRKRRKICAKICQIWFCNPDEIPLKIRSLVEVIPG